MNKIKKPILSEIALEGINAALSRMEADDLTDLDNTSAERFNAANLFVVQMYRWLDRPRKKRQPTKTQ
jgi:hypothetical protein